MSTTTLNLFLDDVVTEWLTIPYIGDVVKGNRKQLEYLENLPAICIIYAQENKTDVTTQQTESDVEIECMCYVPEKIGPAFWGIDKWWDVLDYLFSWMEYKLKVKSFRDTHSYVVSLTCNPRFGQDSDDVRGAVGKGKMTLKIRYRHARAYA